MDITIRNIDSGAYRGIKARAAQDGVTVGEAVSEAIRSYLAGGRPTNRSQRRHMSAAVVTLNSQDAAEARVGGTPADRVALADELSREAWALTGRPLPAYTRMTMPASIVSESPRIGPSVNEDYRDVLASLTTARARFLVVGAHALAVHGVPRATVDLDIWVDRSTANTRLVWQALAAFGAPLDSLKVSKSDLTRPDVVLQLGLPPRRIDILTSLTGLKFSDAWKERVLAEFGDVRVPFLGRRSLVRNKLATGQTKDLADVEALGETGKS
jgi:plasmid stability protein